MEWSSANGKRGSQVGQVMDWQVADRWLGDQFQGLGTIWMERDTGIVAYRWQVAMGRCGEVELCQRAAVC